MNPKNSIFQPKPLKSKEHVDELRAASEIKNPDLRKWVLAAVNARYTNAAAQFGTPVSRPPAKMPAPVTDHHGSSTSKFSNCSDGELQRQLDSIPYFVAGARREIQDEINWRATAPMLSPESRATLQRFRDLSTSPAQRARFQAFQRDQADEIKQAASELDFLRKQAGERPGLFQRA